MSRFLILTVMKLFLIVSWLSMFFSIIVSAQVPTSHPEVALVNAFNQRLYPQIRLFNGISYIDYAGKLDGNAYLNNSNDFTNAMIVYDGVAFPDVPILYDLVQDKLVTLLYDGYSKYSLLSERVSSFSLGNEHYVYYSIADLNELDKVGGFYKQAYVGNASVLVKKSKSFKEIVDNYGARKKFSENTRYYIFVKNTMYYINSESGMLKVFETQKAALKKYLRANNLKFKRQPEKVLVVAASYYDQLSK